MLHRVHEHAATGFTGRAPRPPAHVPPFNLPIVSGSPQAVGACGRPNNPNNPKS